MTELIGDDLHDLPDRELLVVTTVEDLTPGGIGLIHRQKQRVHEVVHVPERNEAQAVVGKTINGRRSRIRRTTHHSRGAS